MVRIEDMNRSLLIAVALTLGAGCQRPSEHVDGHYTPAEGGGEESTNPANAPSPCELAGGALRLELAVPDGYALLASPEACMLVDERAEDPRVIAFSAIPLASEEPADGALEAEPDGVRRWVLEAGLLGDDAEAGGEGRAAIGGVTLDYFIVRATPPDLGTARDVLLFRHVLGQEQLIVMVFLPPDDAEARAALLDILASVDVSEDER